jgi:hypothetical protein
MKVEDTDDESMSRKEEEGWKEDGSKPSFLCPFD